MKHFDAALEGSPEYVWQAGTLNGNPVAASAGLATLAELRKPGAYDKLFATGTRLTRRAGRPRAQARDAGAGER